MKPSTLALAASLSALALPAAAQGNICNTGIDVLGPNAMQLFAEREAECGALRFKGSHPAYTLEQWQRARDNAEKAGDAPAVRRLEAAISVMRAGGPNAMRADDLGATVKGDQERAEQEAAIEAMPLFDRLWERSPFWVRLATIYAVIPAIGLMLVAFFLGLLFRITRRAAGF